MPQIKINVAEEVLEILDQQAQAQGLTRSRLGGNLLQEALTGEGGPGLVQVKDQNIELLEREILALQEALATKRDEVQWLRGELSGLMQKIQVPALPAPRRTWPWSRKD